MRVVVRADARREINEARDYIDEQRPRHGLRFVEALEREGELLSNFPNLGPAISPDRRYRKRHMLEWPYVIYYTVIDSTLFIVAVQHKRRDPETVRGRLR